MGTFNAISILHRMPSDTSVQYPYCTGCLVTCGAVCLILHWRPLWKYGFPCWYVRPSLLKCNHWYTTQISLTKVPILGRYRYPPLRKIVEHNFNQFRKSKISITDETTLSSNHIILQISLIIWPQVLNTWVSLKCRLKILQNRILTQHL